MSYQQATPLRDEQLENPEGELDYFGYTPLSTVLRKRDEHDLGIKNRSGTVVDYEKLASGTNEVLVRGYLDSRRDEHELEFITVADIVFYLPDEMSELTNSVEEFIDLDVYGGRKEAYPNSETGFIAHFD